MYGFPGLFQAPESNPALNGNAPSSLDAFFSFAMNHASEFVTRKIIVYREKALHLGMVLSGLAVLVGLVRQIALTFFLMAGATLCFALSSWAYRTWELGLSQQELKDSQDAARIEGEIALDLKKKIEERELVIEDLRTRAEAHSKEKIQFLEKIAELEESIKKLKERSASTRARISSLSLLPNPPT